MGFSKWYSKVVSEFHTSFRPTSRTTLHCVVISTSRITIPPLSANAWPSAVVLPIVLSTNMRWKIFLPSRKRNSWPRKTLHFLDTLRASAGKANERRHCQVHQRMERRRPWISKQPFVRCAVEAREETLAKTRSSRCSLEKPIRSRRQRRSTTLSSFIMCGMGNYGDHTELGIKKGFEASKGNVGDINLTWSPFFAMPVSTPTRCWSEHADLAGLSRYIRFLPTLIMWSLSLSSMGTYTCWMPSMTFLPFGSISIPCYNGIGRVMNSEGSFWMDINPTEKDRRATMISLNLSDNGEMAGNYYATYFGYAAVKQRKEIAGVPGRKKLSRKTESLHHFWTITSYERTGEDDLSKPLVENWCSVNGVRSGRNNISYSTRFLSAGTETNPFKTDTRMFPVDFAVPLDESITIVIDFPESFEVASMPDQVGLAIPKAGGRYIFGSQVMGNKLTGK